MPINGLGIVYDALVEVGANFAMQPAGYRAIESLRLEKGYRAWGSDITPNENPFEARLGWAVKLKSDSNFLGREAAAQAAASSLKKKLVCFTLDDPEITLVSRETILRNGNPVGYLTSAGFGYTIEKPIGYGYVRNAGDPVTDEYIRTGRYELVVAADIFPAEVHLKPLYDPAMQRIKA